MNGRPSFANLRSVTTPAIPVETTTAAAGPRGPVSRQGRKQIAGFFNPEISFAMHMLARRQGRSLQALMAEAFNDILRKHGESRSAIGDRFAAGDATGKVGV